MVLLAGTAGLRLLGLLLLFVPAFLFFSTASRADFSKAARCGEMVSTESLVKFLSESQGSGPASGPTSQAVQGSLPYFPGVGELKT